jgi:hypothetical protein
MTKLAPVNLLLPQQNPTRKSSDQKMQVSQIRSSLYSLSAG